MFIQLVVKSYIHCTFIFHKIVKVHVFKSTHIIYRGVVGYGEGVLYLSLPGHPTDIGLQLGKACYPCSR